MSKNTRAGVLYCFPTRRAPSNVRKASMSQRISSPIAVLESGLPTKEIIFSNLSPRFQRRL